MGLFTFDFVFLVKTNYMLKDTSDLTSHSLNYMSCAITMRGVRRRSLHHINRLHVSFHCLTGYSEIVTPVRLLIGARKFSAYNQGAGYRIYKQHVTFTT